MATTKPMREASALRIRRGTCRFLLAYDVGHAIDLDLCERMLAESRRRALDVGRSSMEYFEYRPAPLRLVREARPVQLGPRATAPEVTLTLYDFGAVTVGFAIPIEGSLEEAVTLSAGLDARVLHEQGRLYLDELLVQVGTAVRQPRLAPIVEDYTVFHLADLEPDVDPAALWTSHALDVARLLRGESGELGTQEVARAVGVSLSYGPHDCALFDWNAALVHGPELDEVLTVIEFANVQLLEMRLLDHQLDAALDESYALVSSGRGEGLGRSFGPDLRRIARLQVDSAILFERVSSSLKIFGEQYLAAGYRQLAERFRLAEWDATIRRKLETLDGIYGKLADQAAARRMEVLEWIIVVLIAVSIVLPFLT